MSRHSCLLLLLISSQTLAGDIIVQVRTDSALEAPVYAELVPASQSDWQPVIEQKQSTLTKTSTGMETGTEIIFEDIDPGRYAVRLFADLDEDGELDVSLRGLPREPVGFSTCAVAGRREHPPEDCAFEHTKPQTAIAVELVNLRR